LVQIQQIISTKTLGSLPTTAPKLFHMMCHEAGMRILVQIFGAHLPKICRAKNFQKFGTISDDFGIQSQMSPEQIKISTVGKRRYQPSRVWQKKS